MAPKTRISRRKRSIAALGCEETSRESEITVENADANLFSFEQASYQNKKRANKEPMNVTPEKTADRKRGMDAAATALFSSDSEKKYKRQEKESASSSSAMKDESQNKKLD